MALFETALVASDVAWEFAFCGVAACWLVFLVTFGLRKLSKRTSRGRELKQNRAAILGMILEGLGYFMVWFPPLQRGQFVPVVAGSQAAEWCLAIVAVAIAASSTWLVNAASRRLGKQWALAARLVEGHTLIQEGPYRFVRNPIYAGMFGMLLATGLVAVQWSALLLASLLFITGTYIRIRSEEGLLREAFGPDFEAYKRKVPALIPGIY